MLAQTGLKAPITKTGQATPPILALSSNSSSDATAICRGEWPIFQQRKCQQRRLRPVASLATPDKVFPDLLVCTPPPPEGKENQADCKEHSGF
jgi:hypothetical protein